MPTVSKNSELIIGYFQDVLLKFLEKHTELALFIHIDCDLYSSTKYVLETLYLQKRLLNTIIQFDEIHGHEDAEKHELKAWLEFVQKYSIKYKYLGHVPSSEQATLQLI